MSHLSPAPNLIGHLLKRFCDFELLFCRLSAAPKRGPFLQLLRRVEFALSENSIRC